MTKKRLMTEGNIYTRLLIFAFPLVIGSIFQLTYNLFDYVVLGWFASDPIASQAAVGVANPIMNIFISLISGLCVGAGIHTSELFGKKDNVNLKRQISTCIIVGGIVVIALTLLFIILLNPILYISNVLEDGLKEDVYLYLLIISIGFIFSFIYNIYASILRSFGDSVSSLLFLIVSCILNVVFNIIFVIVCKMEVLGVAISTTISQCIAAISIVLYGKIKYKDVLILKRSEYVIDKKLLKITASYAIASCLQQIVLWVGKYIISTQINKYDYITIAAFSSATSIDQFFFSAAQNIGHATAIFIAQNKGAKQYKRAKKGFFAGLSINMVYGVIISILVVLLNSTLLSLFISNDPKIQLAKDQVIQLGLEYLHVMAFLYLCPCITNSLQSYFRGIGKLNFVFYSTTVQIIFRVSSAVLLINLTNKPMSSTAYATGIGWLFMILFELPLLIYYIKTNKTLIDEEKISDTN